MLNQAVLVDGLDQAALGLMLEAEMPPKNSLSSSARRVTPYAALLVQWGVRGQAVEQILGLQGTKMVMSMHCVARKWCEDSRGCKISKRSLLQVRLE